MIVSFFFEKKTEFWLDIQTDFVLKKDYHDDDR